MIKYIKFLEHCTNEQLENIMSHTTAIMGDFEFLTNLRGAQLAAESEEYYRLYQMNWAAFCTLAARLKGIEKRNPEPLAAE